MDRPAIPQPNSAAEQPESADTTAVELRPTSSHSHYYLAAPTVASVMALSLPVILEQLTNAAVGITVTVIAGHIPGGPEAAAAGAAAVGVMSYLQWFAGLLNSAFAVGAGAIVARSIGARRPRVANRVAGTAITGAFLLSVALSVVLYLFASEITTAAGLVGLAHDFGTQYLQIMSITIALQTASMIGMGCLRGAGDTMSPMMISGAVAIVNMVASCSFTFGWLGAPVWGIRGNAVGTMLAYLLGGVATVCLLVWGRTPIRLKFRHFRVIPHVLMRLLRIGMPAWAEGMFLWVGQFLIVILVITRNDQAVGVDGATMAAHTAVLRIESLAFLPGFGFGMACSSFVGRYLGANRAEDALKVARLCTRLAVITMTVAALPMVLFPRQLLSLMVDSAAVVAIGFWPMILAGLAQPGFAISIAKGSALKGAGDTFWPMLSTTAGMVVVRVPILFLLAWLFSRWGMRGEALVAVWIAIFLDLNSRALFNWWVFSRGWWRHKKV